MSFFWSSTYSQPKSTNSSSSVVKSVSAENTGETNVSKNSTDTVETNVSSDTYVSPRSVPSADAFKSVEITRVPRKSKPNLEVNIPAVKSASIADECTPVNSTYNSPRYDVQFEADFNVTDHCSDTSSYTPPSSYSDNMYEFKERVHRLENLFNRGLYHHLKVVHQGVYKDNVINGGHVSLPDRDVLDVRENVHLHNNDVRQNVMELHHKYTELVSQSRQLFDRLEVLTNQLADLTVDF